MDQGSVAAMKRAGGTALKPAINVAVFGAERIREFFDVALLLLGMSCHSRGM